MKRKIIIGSFFAVFILLLIPSIPAVQFNAVVETNKSRLIEEINKIEIDSLRQKIDSLKEIKLEDQIESLLDLLVLICSFLVMVTIASFAQQYPFIGRIFSWIIAPVMVYLVWHYKGLI